MPAVKSQMIKLGTRAPEFTLPNTNNGQVSTVRLTDFENAAGVVIAFICNHCPYVVNLKESFSEFAKIYQHENIAIVAISANDAARYPQDAPSRMSDDAVRYDYSFPYLYDETQQVARAFGAECTPDFFLFDANLELVYRGQYDASRPGNGIEVTGADLRAAIDAMLAGRPISDEQRPSVGCSIKWKLRCH